VILYNADNDVSDWVAQNLFGTDRKYFCENPYSIGLVKDGILICGVVYNNYRETPDNKPISIEMSIFSIDKSWANRQYLRAIFAYPFIQLGLERVQITTSVVNEGINSVVPRIGFKKEGLHRKAHFDGGDCYSWSILKDECRWL